MDLRDDVPHIKAMSYESQMEIGNTKIFHRFQETHYCLNFKVEMRTKSSISIDPMINISILANRVLISCDMYMFGDGSYSAYFACSHFTPWLKIAVQAEGSITAQWWLGTYKSIKQVIFAKDGLELSSFILSHRYLLWVTRLVQRPAHWIRSWLGRPQAAHPACLVVSQQLPIISTFVYSHTLRVEATHIPSKSSI